MQTVRVIQVSPYHRIYGLLIPALAQRLHEGLASIGDETDYVLTNFMSLLWAKNPGVLLVAAVDSTGQVKGYTAALRQNESEVLFIQPRLDEPTENDAVAEMIEHVETWAKGIGASHTALVARRLDSKWSKKFGYEVARYILTKELG